jgi:L-seryl-tRNA(Ser) seleniumtransferase
MSDDVISRRELLRRGGDLGGLLALPLVFPGEAQAAAARGAGVDTVSTGLRPGADVYRSINVRPLINARGTFTIISGSTMLPEVRAAIDAAAQQYVHLDELTEAVGARLAELTKAEWGLVTCGCAAALTHATAASVAGGNPDLHIRLPNLSGFPRDEAIIPTHSRNVYDAAVRAVGVRVIQVSTMAEFEAALGPRTALIYVLAGQRADEGPLTVQAMAPLAKAKDVPILVDAAAEILTIPNVHLERGATLVAYSGGKCIRGPQTGGLLLGRKDLVKAAWVHSAPHHGFGRGFKVGKEEAIGMLAAVEAWVKRDHDAEWKRWTSWLEHIAGRVSKVPGVETSITQPNGLSNRTPSLRIRWDRERLGVGGDVVARTLLDTEPRIALAGGGGGGRGAGNEPNMTGVSVTPYMMAPGDEKVVADRLFAILSKPPAQAAAAPAPPATDLSGQWDVEIRYSAGRSTHALHLRQRGQEIDGAHRGDFVSRDLTGSIDGNTVRLRSAFGEERGDALSYTFNGTVNGDEMSGTLDLGEYLNATWAAKRHVVGRRG